MWRVRKEAEDILMRNSEAGLDMQLVEFGEFPEQIPSRGASRSGDF
jgi:hypothetical protein